MPLTSTSYVRREDINLNIVECRVRRYVKEMIFNGNINLNIVECRGKLRVFM